MLQWRDTFIRCGVKYHLIFAYTFDYLWELLLLGGRQGEGGSGSVWEHRGQGLRPAILTLPHQVILQQYLCRY